MEVRINTHNLHKISRKLQKQRSRILLKIGNAAVNYSIEAFDKQAWNGIPWAKRKHPERKQRALLIKSGALRNSIRIMTMTYEKVTIGSDLPYAAIHNQGGTTHPTVTARMKAYFFHKARKTPKKSGKRQLYQAIALKPAGSQLKIKIPKRQFMGTTPELKRRITKIINREIKNLL